MRALAYDFPLPGEVPLSLQIMEFCFLMPFDLVRLLRNIKSVMKCIASIDHSSRACNIILWSRHSGTKAISVSERITVRLICSERQPRVYIYFRQHINNLTSGLHVFLDQRRVQWQRISCTILASVKPACDPFSHLMASCSKAQTRILVAQHLTSTQICSIKPWSIILATQWMDYKSRSHLKVVFLSSSSLLSPGGTWKSFALLFLDGTSTMSITPRLSCDTVLQLFTCFHAVKIASVRALVIHAATWLLALPVC